VSGYSPEVLPQGASTSIFLAPNVSGSGLLEAVEDAYLLALSDSADANSDGISGRPQYVLAPSYYQPHPGQIPSGGRYIGRFGRKASAIDLRMQTVGAYKQDMGITSPFDLVDPVNTQVASQGGDHVADPEVPATTVDAVAFYLRTLKPPPRRNVSDPQVISGEALFSQVGCASCHRPSLQTGNSEIEALRYKTIYPYTDLLLHDMGTDLDDGYTEGDATPGEWRTPPLWGYGLQQNSQGGRIFLLHDGRAATLDDAIRYHGGEGAASRSAYQQLSPQEKEDLLKFLESL
jgi:CxxC motif-containing protein (DUF1111 family)